MADIKILGGGGGTNLDDITAKNIAYTNSEIEADNVQDAIDALKDNLNNTNHVVTVTLTADGWSDTAPYTQVVNVTGMTEDWVPGNPVKHTNSDVSIDAAEVKCAGYLNRISSGEGTLTFYCYEKKPTLDLTIDVPEVEGRGTSTVVIGPTKDLNDTSVIDTSGLLGTEGAIVNSQELVNAMAANIASLNNDIADILARI